MKAVTGIGTTTFRIGRSGGGFTGRWNAVEVLNGLTRLMPLAAQVGANIGMAEAARKVLEIANRKYVPVTTGALLDSGRVVGPDNYTARFTKNLIASHEMSPTSSFSVSIVYDAPYALFVHEDIRKLHGKEYNAKYQGKPMWKEDTETSKFLIAAMQDESNEVTAILGRSLRESFRRILKNPRRYGHAPSDSAITAVREGMSIIKKTGW